MQTFTIGNKNFTVNAPVLGQLKQLEDIGVNVLKGFDPEELIKDISTLTRFIAIIVCEEGCSLQDKDIDELSEYISFNTTIDKLKELMDFFSSSLSETSGKISEEKKVGQKPTTGKK